jgi:hypothetical protein
MCSAAMRNQFVLALAIFGCPMQMQEQVPGNELARKFFSQPGCALLTMFWQYYGHDSK